MKLNKNLLLIPLILLSKNIFSNFNPTFLTSIPKCGTNLLIKNIKLLFKNFNYMSNYTFNKSWIFLDHKGLEKSSKKINSILVGHIFYDKKYVQLLKKYKAKGIFIFRDPRDQIISLCYWYKSKHPETIPDLINSDIDKLISSLIKNARLFGTNLNIKNCYEKYLHWKKENIIYTTQFEKLVGPEGGGSQEEQIQEIKNISNFLGLKKTDQEIIDITNKLWGNNEGPSSHTFREGQIGSWKKHFTEENKKLFKEIAGQLLIDLGYEKDLNW